MSAEVNRDTLDRYLNDIGGYGNARFPDVRLNTSLLIAAFDYADGANDMPWLRAHNSKLRDWANLYLAVSTAPGWSSRCHWQPIVIK